MSEKKCLARYEEENEVQKRRYEEAKQKNKDRSSKTYSSKKTFHTKSGS
jgi:hypothetical protein